MLFHVTLSHDPQRCPGLRPGEASDLLEPSEAVDEEQPADSDVRRHSVFWGASCILWAQEPHLAYLVLEAPDIGAVQRYVASVAPSGWGSTIVPVWHLPAQLGTVRELLTRPAELERPAQPTASPTADERDAAEPTTMTRVLQELDTPSADRAEADAGEPMSTVILGQQRARIGSERLKLVCTTGPLEGASFEVGEEGATVGRLPDSPISIPDARLSRQHATIEFRDGGFWVVDLGSTNGTAVNGTLVNGRCRLRTGDSIELGSTHLTVTVEGAA